MRLTHRVILTEPQLQHPMAPVCSFDIIARHLERFRQSLTQDIRDGGSLMPGKVLLPLLEKERGTVGGAVELRQSIGLGIEYCRAGCRNLSDIRLVDRRSGQFHSQSRGVTSDGLARRSNLILGLLQARLCGRPCSFCLATLIAGLIAGGFELVSFSSEPGVDIGNCSAAEQSSSLSRPLVCFSLCGHVGLAGCFKTLDLRPRGNQRI